MIKTIGLAITIALASGAASAQTPQQAKKPQRATIYCIEVEPSVGTRIASRVCKTRTQWAREGVDVDGLGKS